MRQVITLMMALVVLMTGCGAAKATPPPRGADTAAWGSGSERAYEPSATSAPAGTDVPVDALPDVRRAEATGGGSDSIVRVITGDGIDGIDIFAELCAVVLEQSAGDSIEAEFSFSEMAAPNYCDHFDLRLSRDGDTVYISTDYEDGRWDTSFAPIDGFDGDQYRETATLTVRLPERQYRRVSLQLVTAGDTLDIAGVDTLALDIRVGTGDVAIRADRAYEEVSVSHKVGDVTMRLPELGGKLSVSSKIGVFTLSLPAEPADLLLRVGYDQEALAAGDEAIYVLPVTWDATVSGQSVHFMRGAGSRHILVDNEKYGVFAVEIDGTATGEPASAR